MVSRYLLAFRQLAAVTWFVFHHISIIKGLLILFGKFLTSSTRSIFGINEIGSSPIFYIIILLKLLDDVLLFTRQPEGRLSIFFPITNFENKMINFNGVSYYLKIP